MAEARREIKTLAWMVAILAGLFFLPVASERFRQAVFEALHLVRWYAREHVLLCLVPAFFIAGAIGVFISQASVMKYLGARANKVVAYGVASVSGSILAVCSCTVLPLFAGIHRMGAGLGPAAAFLYSGPAINVLAIILTARILGPQLGVARAVGAIVFSVVIGLCMHWIYRKEEARKAQAGMAATEPEVTRPLWKNAIFFSLMIGVLVFANWGSPGSWVYSPPGDEPVRVDIAEAPFDPHEEQATYTLRVESTGERMRVDADTFLARREPAGGVWSTLWRSKWVITAVFAAGFGTVLVLWVGAAWWKVVASAGAVALAALLIPEGGLWVLAPFTVGAACVAIVLGATPGEGRDWLGQTWGFAKQIAPLLLAGVLVAGFFLGRPGHAGLIPPKYVQMLVGENPDTFLSMTGWAGSSMEQVVRGAWPVWTNFFASIFAALMYFATLTEVPILQGLIGAGMGEGPALALLLAGPALSLPNMLVIAGVLGARKTAVFVSLVVVMATISGMIYGWLF
jgi:hypothetical protein